MPCGKKEGNDGMTPLQERDDAVVSERGLHSCRRECRPRFSHPH